MRTENRYNYVDMCEGTDIYAMVGVDWSLTTERSQLYL